MGEVDVRVLEAGKHGLTLELDDVRAGADQLPDLVIGADRDDAPARHGDGFGAGRRASDRVDAATENCEVDLHPSGRVYGRPSAAARSL